MNVNGIQEINTDSLKPTESSSDLYEGRKNFSIFLKQLVNIKVTIFVQAYGRLEKTKECVENIIKYTKGIEYQLILFDNGSEDETLEYFKSINYSNKNIFHVTKNIGSMLPQMFLTHNTIGDYLVSIPNDVIVTHNWLKNLINAMESDHRIGMMCPVSSNVSNLQEVNFSFYDDQEMQKKAKNHNIPDPKKWKERLRLITVLTIFRKECLLAIGLPLSDCGFFHDFADDDISFQVRRAGYKIILAGDTWVHHNHDFRNMEDKDPQKFQESLEIGRQNFRDKYHGIDAWDDVNNFIIDITPYIPCPKEKGKKTILGVDVKCGTPILDVKNQLREFGIFEAELSAFTQNADYVADLNTICEGIISCDREEFLSDQFLSEYFDYIVVDRPLNRYHEPQKILNDLMRLLKPNGILIVPVLNTFSFREYVYCLGQKNLYNSEFAYNMPTEVVQAALKNFGDILFSVPRFTQLDQNSNHNLLSLMPKEMQSNQKQELLKQLLIDRVYFGVQKH